MMAAEQFWCSGSVAAQLRFITDILSVGLSVKDIKVSCLLRNCRSSTSKPVVLEGGALHDRYRNSRHRSNFEKRPSFAGFPQPRDRPRPPIPAALLLARFVRSENVVRFGESRGTHLASRPLRHRVSSSQKSSLLAECERARTAPDLHPDAPNLLDTMTLLESYFC